MRNDASFGPRNWGMKLPQTDRHKGRGWLMGGPQEPGAGCVCCELPAGHTAGHQSLELRERTGLERGTGRSRSDRQEQRGWYRTQRPSDSCS